MTKRTSEPLVRAERVTKKFLHEGREIEILRGIDLEIHEGEMLSIVGASGAGKSTLLHILGTLDVPTSGRIVYQGEDVTLYPTARLADFRNRTIGFVFQFHHLLPEFSALENVMMPGLIRGLSRGELRRRATALLDEVGLSHRLSHRPGELSGGEQQRVALARALVMQPKLVLADEPTGNLDSKTSEAMHALFFELNRARGVTFLIVTHSRELAALMPRVVHMVDGRIERDERRGESGAAHPSSAPEGEALAVPDPARSGAAHPSSAPEGEALAVPDPARSGAARAAAETSESPAPDAKDIDGV
jgi:lipoprotein-releasing system ATP-binding protein